MIQTGPHLFIRVRPFEALSVVVDVSGNYVEPWVSYVLPSNTAISVSAESTYDWNHSDLALPINLIVEQLITV